MNLDSCNKHTTPWFSFEGKTFNSKCVDVYDGDTITVIFDTFGTLCKHRIRLDGIDTPEIRTKNTEEKKAGLIARNFLREKILNKIIKLKCNKNDKYGRLLGTVFLDDENINELMISKGYAYKYNGGTKEKF